MKLRTDTLTLFQNQALAPHFLETYRHEKNLLVQVFSSLHDQLPQLQSILDTLKHELPNAVIIGATTDGEIESGNVYSHSTIIAISTFEKTTLRASYCESSNEVQAAQNLLDNIATETTKLLITFTDGTTTNGEKFLSNINTIVPDIPIAGGMAGDNASFTQTYVIYGTKIISQGAVAVSLNSQHLSVETDYSFDWQPLGRALTITKSDQNRVYEIDNMPATKAYGKYLGQEIEDALPMIGIEFPLLLQRNGHYYARAAIAKSDDNSLYFAGNLREGDQVYLGFADVNQVLQNSLQKAQQFTQHNVETFFIYSCMARRRFMSDIIHTEIEPYAQLAPTAGFFTYGEFYHQNRESYLFNETLTFVALSENIEKPVLRKELVTTNMHNEFSRTFKALSHLFKATQKEYEFNQQLLHTVVDTSRTGYFIRHHAQDSMIFSDIAKEIFGLEQFDAALYKSGFRTLLFVLRNLIHPNDRQKALEILHEANRTQKGYELDCRIILPDRTLRYIKIITHLNFDLEQKLYRTIGTIYDLTELKKEQLRHEELSFLVENNGNEVYVIDAESLQYLYANTKSLRILGYSKEQLYKLNVYDTNPDMTEAKVIPMRELLAQKEVITNESVHQRADGSTYPTRSQIYHTHYYGKDAYVIFSTDITKEQERDANEQALKETLENVLDYSSTLFLLTNKTKMVHANKALLEFFGMSNIEELRRKYHCVMDIFEVEENYFSAKSVSPETKGCPCISDLKDKDVLGVVIHAKTQQKQVMKLSLNQLPNESFLISMTNVTEIEQEAKRFQYQANHDKLTGTYNRSYLELVYQQHLNDFSTNAIQCSFILLDIDDFKHINDNYGHLTGDRVLILLSNTISNKIRHDDIFVRWGGEEFLLLLPKTSQSSALKIAEVLRQEIMKLDIGIGCSITSSFGVTSCQKRDTKESLFERLDQALYMAKDAGKNCVIEL